MRDDPSDPNSYRASNEQKFDGSTYLSEGFKLLKRNFVPLVGYGIFCVAIQVGFEQLAGIGNYANIPARIANVNLVAPLYAGFFYFLFRELKGEKPDIKAFFSGFQRNRLFALTVSFLLPLLLSFLGGYSFFWLGDSLQLLGFILLACCFLYSQEFIFLLSTHLLCCLLSRESSIFGEPWRQAVNS